MQISNEYKLDVTIAEELDGTAICPPNFTRNQ